jgi:hypothetical protein
MKKENVSVSYESAFGGLNLLNIILPPFVNLSPWTSNSADIPSLVNQVSILKSYGFTAGYFIPRNPLTMHVDPGVELEFGRIEAEETIDTAEEFITAGWFHPFTRCPGDTGGIERELPHTRDGAMKLCAMWMKKRAENRGLALIGEKRRDYYTNYSDVIDKIINSRGLQRGAAEEYYKIAITDRILRFGDRELGYAFSMDTLERSVLKPLIEYYLNPRREAFDKIVGARVYFARHYAENENDRRISGFLSVLSGIDFSLYLASQKHADRELNSPSLPEWSPGE